MLDRDSNGRLDFTDLHVDQAFEHAKRIVLDIIEDRDDVRFWFPLQVADDLIASLAAEFAELWDLPILPIPPIEVTHA